MVRRIFRAFATGTSPRAIAVELNSQRAWKESAGQDGEQQDPSAVLKHGDAS